MALQNFLYAKENRRPGKPRNGEGVDLIFLCLLLLLLGVGLVMLYSASYAQSHYDTGYTVSTRYLQKQGLCAVIGLIAMYGFSRIPANLWYHLAWPLYGVSIVLLLSVLFRICATATSAAPFRVMTLKLRRTAALKECLPCTEKSAPGQKNFIRVSP